MSRNITLEQAECVKLLYMENNHSLVLTTQSVFQSMNHSVCSKKGMKTNLWWRLSGNVSFYENVRSGNKKEEENSNFLF